VKGSRPERLVVVVGTGTDVGKTWVSAALLAGCRASGMTVAARKPAQSFEPGAGLTDAEVLSAATGEEPKTICLPHRWYEVPFAPPMAADSLGRPAVCQGDLLDEMDWTYPGVSLGLVEMAGGVCSPISHDGDSIGFVRALQPDNLLLVADAGLGTINSITLTLDAIHSNLGADDTPCFVVLNRFDDSRELHVRNAIWLANRGIDAVMSPSDDTETCAKVLIHRMWPS
jgi:dethiobiotin synthetase